MKTFDVDDIKTNASHLLESIETENVVITKNGKPVAILQPLESHAKSYHSQYSAMVKAWGDPLCDVYDEAFMDD